MMRFTPHQRQPRNYGDHCRSVKQHKGNPAEKREKVWLRMQQSNWKKLKHGHSPLMLRRRRPQATPSSLSWHGPQAGVSVHLCKRFRSDCRPVDRDIDDELVYWLFRTRTCKRAGPKRGYEMLHKEAGTLQVIMTIKLYWRGWLTTWH